MMTNQNEPQPVTVIVRRRVKRGKEVNFEAAMQEFIRFALSFPGHVGIHVLRPDHDSRREYTVVDRFADAESRAAFKSSATYQDWMHRLAEFTEDGPQIHELSGIAGWFPPPAHVRGSAPPRLKMASVTFLGVYPLTSVLPPLYGSLLPSWPHLLRNIVVTATIVAALTWVVMPLLTRVFRPWLFPRPPRLDGAPS